MNKVENINQRPSLKFYDLNNPGTVWTTTGENLSLTSKGGRHLAEFLGMPDADQLRNRPITNLSFYKDEGGELTNSNWNLELQGFDESFLQNLDKAQAASLRLLPVSQDLADFTDSRQMAEIGFNVHGQEIVLKRILLPSNYQAPDNLNAEPLFYQGSQMPQVFVEAWEQLEVGRFDSAWDKRVKEQLEGNRRNLDKQIVYQMINGRKWVDFNGGLIWAGLLCDKKDIDRFLKEEAALSKLKPGEFLAAKYSHGSGGAISAATAGERLIIPPVVGDVQMMGPDGLVYQQAIEGSADQIDTLMNELVSQMHGQLDFKLPGQTAINFTPQFAVLPVLSGAALPLKDLVIPQKEPVLLSRASKDKAVNHQILVLAKPTGNNKPDVLAVPVIDEPIVVFSAADDFFPTTKDEFLLEADSDGDIDGWPPDDEPKRPGSDGDDWPLPEKPNPGGGGLSLTKQERIDVKKDVFKPATVDKPKPAAVFSQENQIQADLNPTEMITEPEATVTLPSPIVHQENEDLRESVEDINLSVEKKSPEPKIPWWQMPYVKVLAREEVPTLFVNPAMVELNHSLVVPGLKAEENLTETAETAFEQGKWPEFDYLNQIINQVEEIVFTSLFVIANTTWLQLEPEIMRVPALVTADRGRGFRKRAI